MSLGSNFIQFFKKVTCKFGASIFPIAIKSFFQYNAWAVPCNNVIECDGGKDENDCDTPSWHRWIALMSILSFFVLLFILFLKFKLKENNENPEFPLQPIESQYKRQDSQDSLDRNSRALLVLRLQDGGKEEANKVYNQIYKEEQHQSWHLKVI